MGGEDWREINRANQDERTAVHLGRGGGHDLGPQRAGRGRLDAPVPFVATIIGEGGSGGAIALASADRVLMLEHAIYSVISPEGCASILWKDADKMREAADALRLTAQDLDRLGVIDRIIREPLGGAHRDTHATIQAVGEAVQSALADLTGRPGRELRDSRRRKFLGMGSKGLAA